MGARFRSWWQQLNQRRVAIVVTTAIIVVAVALIIVGYWFDVTGFVTGFNGYTQVSTIRTLSGPTAGTVTRTEAYQPGKTLWDWLQLLIIPLALAIIAIFFNRAERRNEQMIASDNQQEAALQGYIDKMSELLLHENLRKSKPEHEVRKIARVRTLAVLPRLDGKRKSSILQFLFESGLIEKDNAIVDISEADLSGAYLFGANLSGAYLKETILKEANLRVAQLDDANLFLAKLNKADLVFARMSGANLKAADLEEANLWAARMENTDLSRANLTKANLHEAKVTEEQLKTAGSLKGATMPDGSIHP